MYDAVGEEEGQITSKYLNNRKWSEFNKRKFRFRYVKTYLNVSRLVLKIGQTKLYDRDKSVIWLYFEIESEINVFANGSIIIIAAQQ